MSVVDWAKQYWENSQREVANKIDAYNKDFYQQTHMTPVQMAMNMGMGATTAPTTESVNLAKMLVKNPLSIEDRNIMGNFVRMVENGGKKAMGNIGYYGQRIGEQLGAAPEASNQALANLFNEAVRIADKIRR